MKTFLLNWLLPVVSFLLLAPPPSSAQIAPAPEGKVKVKVKGGPGAADKTKVKIPVTTIYIVRHAEKDSLTDPADPELSALGRVRATALSQQLAKRQPAALFTTDTKRTRATLAPLAAATKLEPQVYDPARGRDLADKILKEYPGRSVVIVGHSNNVLSLIDDFGAVPPIDQVGEKEYDYLFVVRSGEGLMPTVEMRGYGAERNPKAEARAQARATPAPAAKAAQ
ncbi:MAG: histidine phosphatase family protein [Bacteroidota bacterium]|nr:histidine phosphatase family protein [Bacteroidota bacterium]